MLKSQLNIHNYFELTTRQQPIAGIDEVGRGALCGPVVAAAVILQPEFYSLLIEAGVRDSKKLSPKEREALVPKILAVTNSYHIALATATEIDRMGIAKANFLAMSRAIEGLVITPEVCFVDGKYSIPGITISQKCLIKGDDRSVSIAAASIVAKVHRDQMLRELAIDHPEYDFVNNKGYGTPKHRSALEEHGAIPEHRQSFLGGISLPKRRKHQ
jgi:ribonuclease HII